MERPFSLLAIFAHPDDETFRPGGSLALLARQGARIQVLTATRGESGSCGDPPLCTPEELPAVRERELHCACAALGLQPPALLGYPDEALAQVDPETLIAEIVSVARIAQPQVLLSFGPDGLSGHLDHITIGALAAEAYRRLEQAAALYTMAVPQSLAQSLGMRRVHPVPDEAIALKVDVSSVWKAKMAAMLCHATQRSSSPMLSAPEERQKMFFGQEYFVRAALRCPGEDFLPVLLQKWLQ